MENNQFVSLVFEDLNTFRRNPSSMVKKFENLKTAMTRFKGQEQFVKDVEQFINSLKTTKGVDELTMNPVLTKLAKKQIEIFQETGKFVAFVDNSTFLSRANEYIEGFTKIQQLCDEGAETGGDVLSKVIFNKNDKEKKNRKTILDGSFQYIGIAHKVLNSENVTVMVFADKCFEKQVKEVRKDYGHLDELKQAFDLFDVNNIGKINPQEALDAMKIVGYNKKNPTMFNIMAELATPENTQNLIDFDTFVEHITGNVENTSTENGLKNIYHLIIDDPNQDTINLDTMKKVCQELGINVTVDELRDMIESTTANGKDITFEEFVELLMNKYGAQNA